MRAITVERPWVGLAATMVALLVGCGGDNFVTQVDLPAAQRHKLTANLKPGAVIKLPSDLPFNVRDKRWNSTPGPDGQANPSADATAQGTAFCKADGGNGGSSWAEFQLGHCLDNHSGTPILAELRMNVDYEHACHASGPGAKTVSKYAIKAFVKDTAGKVLKTLPLASHSSDDGQVNWSGTEKTISTLTLQPGLGYYILLAGRAEADSRVEASSSAQIRVKSFALDITCKRARPASAPRTAPSTTSAPGGK